MNLKATTFFLLFALISAGLQAEITMPHIFSDNMIIQRNRPVKIWGWAKPGESIEVSFSGENAKTRANTKGARFTTLKPIDHGGPYQMVIKGRENTITYRNVLMGDVWLCSGQSNMEIKVKDFNYSEKEMMAGTYPQIRFFSVSKNISESPEKDLSGKWEICTPASILNFRQ
jgi:sialate O-acetylesterase